MIKTKKYKLIKGYPNSMELGAVVEFNGAFYQSQIAPNCPIFSYRKDEVEGYPEFWEELKVPLFKTNDGVDVYENSEVWFVRVNEPEASSSDTQWMIGKYAGDWYSRSTSNAYKWFSTKEAAEKYVYDNKPLYSRKDIDAVILQGVNEGWFNIACYGSFTLNNSTKKVRMWMNNNISKDE